MRQRMWRSILALSIGAAISASASAQAPAVQAPAPIAQATPVVAVSTSGGCNSCGNSGTGSKHSGGLFRIGQGCASTADCSSCKAERTFLFGSCGQFFHPGNDCGHGGNGGKVYGPRAASPPCTYFSYHHR